MAFSEKSRELRAERNLTQIQLANELNISRSCISMIEIGKNEPTATTLIAYAKFFDVSADYLLELNDFGGTSNSAPMGTAATMSNTLSRDERELIEKYRELNAPGKKLIDTTINTLLSASAETEKKRN